MSFSFEEIGASEFKIYRRDSHYGILSSVLNRLISFLRRRKKVRGKLIETNHVFIKEASIQKISGNDIVIDRDGEIEYSGILVVSIKHSAIR